MHGLTPLISNVVGIRLTRDHGQGEEGVGVPGHHRLGVVVGGVVGATVAQRLHHPQAPCPLHSCLHPAQTLPMPQLHQHATTSNAKQQCPDGQGWLGRSESASIALDWEGKQ